MAGDDRDEPNDLTNTQRGSRWSVSYGVCCPEQSLVSVASHIGCRPDNAGYERAARESGPAVLCGYILHPRSTDRKRQSLTHLVRPPTGTASSWPGQSQSSMAAAVRSPVER
jgi:hypothetical protein